MITQYMHRVYVCSSINSKNKIGQYYYQYNGGVGVYNLPKVVVQKECPSRWGIS